MMNGGWVTLGKIDLSFRYLILSLLFVFYCAGSVVTDSVVTDSVVTDSVVTDSVVTDSVVTDSVVTDSVVTDSTLLSLASAVKLLLDRNIPIQIAKNEWHENKRKLRAAWWDFEPELVGGYTNKKTSRINSLSDEEEEKWRIGVEGTIITGTEYSLEHSQKSVKYAKNSLNVPTVFTGVTFTQPLLKGVWFGTPVGSVKIAKVEKKIALQNVRAVMISEIAELERLYWELAFAQEVNAFARRSVEMAQKIVDESELWLRVGKISNLDVLEADASLAERRSYLVDTELKYETAIKNITVLLAIDTFSTDIKIKATDTLAVLEHDLISADTIEQVVKIGFGFQPQRLIKKYELERENHILSFHKDQVLPELNVTGEYGVNGDGKTLSQAQDKYLDEQRRETSFSAGLELRIPLGASGRARNLLMAEKEKVRNAEKALLAVEQEIAAQTILISRNIEDYRVNIQNIEEIVNFREKLLEAEFIRVKSGKSNIRLLFEMESDLLKTHQWRLESILKYRTAQSQLTALSGNGLQDYGFEKIVDGEPIINNNVINIRRKN